jgi:primosomal protein N'
MKGLVKFNYQMLVVVDTKKIEQKDRSKVILSPQLKEAVQSVLGRNRQVILFQKPQGVYALSNL